MAPVTAGLFKVQATATSAGDLLRRLPIATGMRRKCGGNIDTHDILAAPKPFSKTPLDFTEKWTSGLSAVIRVLKAVDHFQKPEDIIGRPVIGILYGFRNGTG